MTELLSIFTAFGLSFSAGLNAYIPLFIIGTLAHYTDAIHLTRPWDTLANPYVLIFLAVLIMIEFLADKVPAFNHINDAIQTFVRPTAGAVAFAATAGVITNIHPALALACGLLIAGGVHTVKSAAIRPMVTATTGGAGNAPVSLAEDLIAIILSILAIVIPVLIVLICAIAFVLVARWAMGRQAQKPA
jgi:uncharacterized protein DUF4126